MRDRIPGAPGQYTAVVTSAELQKLQNAEQFIITLMRDDQPLVEGTPYSKAAVLPDEVASRLCPEVDDPTPADAFQAAAQHLFSRGNPHGVTAEQVGAAVNTVIEVESVNTSLLSILQSQWDSLPWTWCGTLSINRGGNAIAAIYSKAGQNAGAVLFLSYAINGNGIVLYKLSGETWTEYTF